MAHLKDQILQTLTQTPNQLARDMAEQFGVDKKQVNSLLFGLLKGQVQQDAAYRWSLFIEDKVKASLGSKPIQKPIFPN